MPPINNFSPIPPLGQAPAKGKDLDIAIKILKGMNPSDSPTLKKNMKEFIDRNAITAHNKELKYDVPEQTGGLLVTSPFGQEASIMPQVPKKKVIHKDDANVFNTKITQEKDASSIKKEEKPVNIKIKKSKAKPEEKKTNEVVEETKKNEVKELKE